MRPVLANLPWWTLCSTPTLRTLSPPTLSLKWSCGPKPMTCRKVTSDYALLWWTRWALETKWTNRRGECVIDHEQEWQSTSLSQQNLLINPVCLSCSYQPVVDYIDRQFESYLQEELKIKRSLHNYHDSRVHACLYFISPSGHSLKSLDLVTMKKLDSKVGERGKCVEVSGWYNGLSYIY